MFMGGIVVEDGVDDFTDENLSFDGIQEENELLMAVALHGLPITEPSSTFSTANSVVVPWRL
jgi:hypothetical protein